MCTHRDYMYRANRLLQALRKAQESPAVSFFVTVYSKAFGFDPVAKGLISYLLEGLSGYAAFLSTQDLDDIALCIDLARGSFSWYFPTPELLNRYKHLIASVPTTYVHVGFTDILVPDLETRDLVDNPYSSLQIVNCRRYGSPKDLEKSTSFASKIKQYKNSNNVLDVPLLAFLRDAFIPTVIPANTTPSSSPLSVPTASTRMRDSSAFPAGASQSGKAGSTVRCVAYSTIEGSEAPDVDPQYRNFLYEKANVDFKALPIDVLYRCIYHIDSQAAHSIFHSIQTINVQFTEYINKARTLVATLPPEGANLGELVSTTVAEPLQTTFQRKRSHYLSICSAMRAASTMDDFFSRESTVKYYSLIQLTSKDSGSSEVNSVSNSMMRSTAGGTGSRPIACGGVIDIGLVHPMYPLQFRRSMLLEPPKTMFANMTEWDGVPVSVLHSFYYIAGAVASQLSELVTLLVDELGLGHKLYAKSEDLASVVDSSLGTLKSKVAGALTTTLQTGNLPISVSVIKQAVALTSGAIKISCEQYNLGMTKTIYGRGLYHMNLAIQVRLPYTPTSILALTLVHGDTVMTYPGGYCLLGAGLSSARNMTAQLYCSDKFMFKEMASLTVKQQKQINLVCNLKLLHYVSIDGKKLLLPSTISAPLPCLLHFNPGFNLNIWLQNLGECTVHLTPNWKSQAFASTKAMYVDTMNEFYKYIPILTPSENSKALMLFTRVLTAGEKQELKAQEERGEPMEQSHISPTVFEKTCDYVDNDLSVLSHIVGHALAGEFAASTDLTSRRFKMVVTTAIRLLLVDGGIPPETMIAKLRNLSALYKDNFVTLGFVQMYETMNSTAAHGLKCFKQERGGDFYQDTGDLPQTIVQPDDLLDIIWGMAKAVCKEADLPLSLQHISLTEQSKEKITRACMLHNLLGIDSATESATVPFHNNQDVSNTTVRVLLEQSSKRVEQQGIHAHSASSTLMDPESRCTTWQRQAFKEGTHAIAVQDALKLQAAMGIAVSEKLISQSRVPLDCVDSLCITKCDLPAQQSATSLGFCDREFKVKVNNHVVLITGLADLAHTFVSLFSAALQSELNGSSMRLQRIISRSLNERSFLTDMVALLPTLTNTVLIGQITSEGSLSMLLECIGTLVSSRHVTTVRHVSLTASLTFNVHFPAGIPNKHLLLFSPLLVSGWTRKLVVLTEPGMTVDRAAADNFQLYPLSMMELNAISAAPDPQAATQQAIKSSSLLDILSVQTKILSEKPNKTSVGSDYGYESGHDEVVVTSLALPGNQVTDICFEITQGILDDSRVGNCTMLTAESDIFSLFTGNPTNLALDRATGTLHAHSPRYHVIKQVDSAYTDTMLRRSLGGMRHIIETRRSLKANICPKMFSTLLSACDTAETQGNVRLLINFSNSLFIELTTHKNVVSAGRYNVDEYSAKKFFPNLQSKVTVLSSEPGNIFEQPCLDRLLTSLIEELFRELFVELAPTTTEIKSHVVSVDPLAVPEDLNSLRAENVSWGIVREYYDDEKLPPGWYYDGIKYISMDGERSNERPDKSELMKRFLGELEAKTLKSKKDKTAQNTKQQQHAPVTKEIENDILKLNIKDNEDSDNENDQSETPFVPNMAIPEAVEADKSGEQKSIRTTNPIGAAAAAIRENVKVGPKGSIYAKTSLPISRDAAIVRPSGVRTRAGTDTKK